MQRYMPAAMLILILLILGWGGQQLLAEGRIFPPAQQGKDIHAELNRINQHRAWLNTLSEALDRQQRDLRDYRLQQPNLAGVLPEAEIKPEAPRVEPERPPEALPVLSLVYLSDDFRRATIDGQVVQEGETVGRRWIVKRIDLNGVTLARQGEQIFLPVPDSALQAFHKGGAG